MNKNKIENEKNIFAFSHKFPLLEFHNFCRGLLATTQNFLRQGQLITLTQLIMAQVTALGRPLDARETYCARKWHRNAFCWHFLRAPISHPQVSEIIVHNHQQAQVDTGNGLKHLILHQWSFEEFQLALEILVYKNAVAWNYTKPFASFRCAIGIFSFRASLAHSCLNGDNSPKLFLRKLSFSPYPLLSFIGQAPSASDERKKVLELTMLVRHKHNIIIAGATNSGKTSLLNALLPYISSHEHTLIMEDTQELAYARPGVTHLLAQAGTPHRGLVDYCHYALRMRPDRIILGEIRSEEIVPLVLALQSGHKGLLATCHANSAEEVSEKLALLFSLFAAQKNFSLETAKRILDASIQAVIYMEKRKIAKILKLKIF